LSFYILRFAIYIFLSKAQIFLFLCLSFVFGVFIRSLIEIPQLLWLGILISGLVLTAMNWVRNKRILALGFCLMILSVGVWRQETVLADTDYIKQFNDRGKIILAGVVSDEPDVRSDNVKYQIKVDAVRAYDYAKDVNNQALSLDETGALGEILLTAKKYPQYNYGDRLEVAGQLKTPATVGDFDYQKYLAKDDIYSVIYYPEIKLVGAHQGNWLMEKLFAIKNKFENSIEQILSEPQAAFLAGLLLGEKRGLPQNLTDAFARTGTTHIIALSGYNITIIAAALIALFNFFMLRRSFVFWLSAAAILLFVLLTGASASVVRAAVMGILVLVAQQAGRLYRARNALIFAGALMVLINPKVLVFDLGFELSFAATLGLIYLTPIFERWFAKPEERDKTPGFILAIKQISIATLSAQLAVLPLLIINFGQLSLISPLANLLILPFIPLTMFWGFAAAIVGFLNLSLGKILGWLAWLLLTYEIKITEFLAQIPAAALKVDWSWLAGTVYYAILLCGAWYFSRRYKKLLINVVAAEK